MSDGGKGNDDILFHQCGFTVSFLSRQAEGRA
jgi:hypothetical protein